MPTLYSELVLGQERVNGFYETPQKTVEYISNNILAKYQPGMKILDPTVGDGVFLHTLIKGGVERQDLYGFDVDSAKIGKLKTEFPNVKVFDATNPFPIKFDFILGNPPYNGDESHFVRNNRERLKKLFKEIDAKNTYSMVSYQSINALKPGGIFSMILSDSFLTNVYYSKFRKYLLRNTKITELLLAPRKLFHNKSADVRTCIVTAIKKDPTTVFVGNRSNNIVKLIDRVTNEDDYIFPKHIEHVEQAEFHRYPNFSFVIGVPKQLRDIYLNSEKRLGDVVEGGTGISTGNDKRFLMKKKDVLDFKNWVPYYKNGARQAYWYDPQFYIEKDYDKNASNIDNYLVRNKKYFFKEGVSCSSVGARFSATYMPAGCLFGVNANFFFKDRETLFYTLSFLNSKIAAYFARKILIRTNNISANYLRLLPYMEPSQTEKRKISRSTEKIVHALKTNPEFDYSKIQGELDSKFYKIFNLNKKTIEKIEDFTSNIYENL